MIVFLYKEAYLSTTLKVQIQFQGAEHTPTSKIATLHHQIVYRLQNHALLPTPHTTSDALMILANLLCLLLLLLFYRNLKTYF